MEQSNNLDVFRTNDGTVSKYIHDDESETAIKIVKSIQSIFNPITNQIEIIHSDRNKYSLFISCSAGCHMKCKFCHLTLKNAKHQKLPEDTVLQNLKDALEDKIKFNPDIKNKYIKLSWMGMGDAINKPEMVYYVTLKFLDWVFENHYAKGLDGVDLSTVMPKLKNDDFIPIFHTLEKELQKYTINPAYKMDNHQFSSFNYSHKTIFRLFYSLESTIQEQRDIIVPNAMPIAQVIPLLQKYQTNNFSIIFHHLIIENLNDSEENLNSLIDFMTTYFPDNELRILRYNFCAKSKLKESEKFTKQIKYLSSKINNLKVQVSPGTEVSAACGQFIVKQFVNSGKQLNE